MLFARNTKQASCIVCPITVMLSRGLASAIRDCLDLHLVQSAHLLLLSFGLDASFTA